MEPGLGIEMCRKLTIAALVLMGLSVLAFTPYLNLFGPSGADVTPASLGAIGWWEPSRAYVTNSGTAVLSNLAFTGSSYDLTNVAGIASPFRNAGKNGFSGMEFTTNCFLVNQFYATVINTQEVFMVLYFTNDIGNKNWIRGIAHPAASHSSTVGGGLINMKAGSVGGVVCSFMPINKYFVLDMIYRGGGNFAPCLTNNVSTGELTSFSTTNNTGIILGSGGLSPSASLLSYCGFTNVLSTAQRLSLYSYFTNRFGVMP